MASRDGMPLRGAIVAMTRDNVIGLDNGIPWHYPEDLRRFKRRTTGCTVVMGRKTWESIGARPLVNRRNIVISSKRPGDIEWYPDPESALARCDGDTWIIGGGQIYRATLEWIEMLDITRVPDRIESDRAVRFPDIDEGVWHLESRERLDDPRLENRIYRKAAT